MTTIHLLGPPAAKPGIRGVTPAPAVPIDLEPSSGRRHARRVRDLMRAVSAATRLADGRDREGFADLLALGIGLSQAVDLGIIGEPGNVNWRDVWPHAFPTGRTKRFGGCRFRESIRLDTPRYQAAYRRGCPILGPRGGTCHNPHALTAKWVTDKTSGTYEYREICRDHQPEAFQRHLAAPRPAPNRGGILAAVFDDYDMDGTYRYVTPEWDSQAGTPEAGGLVPLRPKLSLVIGGEG